MDSKRIEARVFGALRDVFMSPELIVRFEQALEKERRNIKSGAIDTKLSHLRSALQKAETAQSNILNAIAEGATFKSKAEALEQEIKDLTARISEIQTQVDIKVNKAESAVVIYERALNQMNLLLSDADLVDEASSYLKMLIKKIVFLPDSSALHGIAVTMQLSSDALFAAIEQGENGGKRCEIFKEC